MSESIVYVKAVESFASVCMATHVGTKYFCWHQLLMFVAVTHVRIYCLCQSSILVLESFASVCTGYSCWHHSLMLTPNSHIGTSYSFFLAVIHVTICCLCQRCLLVSVSSACINFSCIHWYLFLLLLSAAHVRIFYVNAVSICWRRVLALAMPYLLNPLHLSALSAHVGNAISLESVSYVSVVCLCWQCHISWIHCICRRHALVLAMSYVLNPLHMSASCARVGNTISL